VDWCKLAEKLSEESNFELDYIFFVFDLKIKGMNEKLEKLK